MTNWARRRLCVQLYQIWLLVEENKKKKNSLQLQIKPDRAREEIHSRLRDDILLYISAGAFGESNRNALTEVPLRLCPLLHFKFTLQRQGVIGDGLEEPECAMEKASDSYQSNIALQGKKHISSCISVQVTKPLTVGGLGGIKVWPTKQVGL